MTVREWVDHVRFVDLRHTCAALALQGGMEIGELSKMLGHTRTTITRQNYALYLPRKSQKKAKAPAAEVKSEELIKAAEQLSGLLKF